MKKIIVDASVAAKWFFPEEGSSKALHLLSGEYELMAPDLLYSEFGNIVWKIHRKGIIDSADALEIVNQFQMLPIDIHPTERLLPTAFEIAISSGSTVYDSMYLAMGLCTETPVITADNKFYKGIKDDKLRKFVKLL